MKKSNKIIYIALIFVVITMIVIGYLILTSNGKIIKQKEGETKAATTSGSNSYITTEQHLEEVSFTANVNKSSIPLIYANFKSNNFSHFIYDVKNLKKITMIVKAGTTYKTQFWGSNQEIPKKTITTIDGETYDVYEAETDIFKPANLGAERITVDGGINYKYSKHVLDVSSYNYFHIFVPDGEYRDWIVHFECE